MLRSTYRLPVDFETLTVHSPSRVRLQRIDVEIDTTTYQGKFRKLVSSELIGQLDDKPFAHGGMKLVFDVRSHTCFSSIVSTPNSHSKIA